MNHDSRLEVLEKTLARLENSNRRLRFLLCLAGLAAVPFLVGAGFVLQDKIVRTGALEIVNAQGKTVARLGSDEDGGKLTLMNSAGMTVAQVGVDTNGGGYAAVVDSGERAGVTLDTDADGGQVVVYAKEGNPGAALQIASGSGLLSVYNATKTKVVETGATSEGAGYTTMWDQNNDELARMPSRVP